MHLSWRERLEQSPSYKNFNNWPYIDLYDLPKSKQKTFNRNCRIITSVLENMSFNRIAKRNYVSTSHIYHLLKRSLAGDAQSPPPLTKALIPGYRLRLGHRKKPLSQGANYFGNRGAFMHIMRSNPEIRVKLDKMILAHLKKLSHGQNLTPNVFHSEFLRLLREKHWPQDKYPFNQEKRGYETARKYFHQRSKELTKPKEKIQRTVNSITPSNLIYQELQIDSQVLDVTTSIYLEVGGELLPHRLSRLSLYLVKDVASDCILSFQLCFTKSPTQIDLLNLLENIHKPWRPMKLKTPGLEYEQGACLPSCLGTEFENAGIGIVRLDNALCHLSHLVRDYICESLGATFNLGLPGNPKGRNYVEYAFKQLSDQMNRFASTSGSYPTDPIRESKSNRKKPPKLTINALEEVLSVLITSHNIKASDQLKGRSPMEEMKYQMRNYPIPLFRLNKKPDACPYKQIKKVKIKWNKRENRDPYINFLGVRYNGKCISSFRQNNKEILVEIDCRDIRILKAFAQTGEEIGELYAPKSWQKFAHSTKTRQKISKITKLKRLDSTDPLSGYFDYLLENRELPKISTELIRVSREYSATIHPKEKLEKRRANFQKIKRSRLLSKKAIASWSPNLYSDGPIA